MTNLGNFREECIVSVVIPIYNAEREVEPLLNAVVLQSLPEGDHLEVIAVDNNSTDETLKRLQEFSSEFSHPNISLKVLSEKLVQSSYAARNLGIRESSGGIILFTDSDCIPACNWVSDYVHFFRTHPSVGIAVGEIQAKSGSKLSERYSEAKEILSQKHTLKAWKPYGQTANLGVRKIVFKQIGLFRPYLWTGGDADICWRMLIDSDFKLETLEGARIYHRHRESALELYKQFYRYGQSAELLSRMYGYSLPQIKSVFVHLKDLCVNLFRLPKSALKIILGRCPVDSIFYGFLDVLTSVAWSRGRKSTKEIELDLQIPLLK